MKWQRARRSTNVEDRRGMGMRRGRGVGGLGLGGLAIIVVIALVMGKNPLDLLGLLADGGGLPQTSQVPTETPASSADDPQRAFVESILGETEDVWGEVFRQSGSQYAAPRLELFSYMTTSTCGQASAAVGPFYCPGDQKIYIDLGFFDEMRARLGGGGDFAEAYVIAHEVGHHIQTLTGVSRQVNERRARGGSVEGAEGPLVRQELQADCYAGVWAHVAQQRHDWLEPGDIEEALNTASAIGDDNLQLQSRGSVVPDSFTHGTSEQRVRWFKTGFESGDPDRCDTFGATRL